MNNTGIFLSEPNINKKYLLMFTKNFSFIKIFGKEILIWSIKNALQSHKDKKCDLYIHITEYNKNDIYLMIEKISEGNYEVMEDFKFFCKDINLIISFIFDINSFNQIKNDYKQDYYEYAIGQLSDGINLNDEVSLNHFFAMINHSAYKYFYVPEHEQKQLFKLYDKIV
jgi:hypothetical protein